MIKLKNLHFIILEKYLLYFDTFYYTSYRIHINKKPNISIIM